MAKKEYLKTIDKNKAEKGKVLIYSLSDNETNEIRYIGKTQYSLYSRYIDHTNFSSKRSKLNYYSKNWIKSLLINNKYPIIEIIDIVSIYEWEQAEEFYISYFKFLGFNLVNFQKGGGQGNIGKNWKISSEKLQNIRNNKLKRNLITLNLYDIKGNIIKHYNNYLSASDDLKIKYNTIVQSVYYKTLINKEYFLIKHPDKFNYNLLKRTQRKIKITNNTELIFNSLKEACAYLKIPNASVYKYLDKNIPYNNNIIERI